MKYLILLFALTFFVSCKTNPKIAKSESQPHFRNQGEQEDYWAKQFFEREYKKTEYPKFIGEITTYYWRIQFGDKQQVEYSHPKPEYKLIFEKGLLYPEILNLDTMEMCCLEELPFLSNDPQIKRFRFWMHQKIGNVYSANPSVYLFELTNETANEETDWKTFIENATLTFIKYGWSVI